MVLAAEEKIKIVQFWYETISLVSVKRSFGESTAVIPQKRHTIMPFRVLYNTEKARGQCMERIRGDPVGHQW